MKIYTKTGDTGETSLYGGERRPKSDVRIQAYGDVDELQAALGVVLSVSKEEESKIADITVLLQHVQYEGFVLGAELARTETKPERGDPSISEEEIKWLEEQIDHYQAQLPPLQNFIMQGGTYTGSHLHLARAICRRAERSVVILSEWEQVSPHCVTYLNRLSDLLFVLARVVNHRFDQPEIPWKNRN